MAGDVGVSALLPGETRCRHVHDGFLELLVLYRVVDGHVGKPEVRDGQIEGLVVRPTRVPAQVEGFDGRYHPGRSVRSLRLAPARTLFVPVLVLRRGLLEVLIVEHLFGENGLGARLGTRLPCRLCGLVSARIATRLRVGPRHGHDEGRTVRHRRAVRVEDAPPPGPRLVPDADGVVVDPVAIAPLLWYRAYEVDGVRVPVDARLG